MFTPDGKEVGPLGDDLDRVNWDMLYFESDKISAQKEEPVSIEELRTIGNIKNKK